MTRVGGIRTLDWESNPGRLRDRQMRYQLSHKSSNIITLMRRCLPIYNTYKLYIRRKARRTKS